MSITIPDLDMPDNCKECKFVRYAFGYYGFECCITGLVIDYDIGKRKRPGWACPIKEGEE